MNEELSHIYLDAMVPFLITCKNFSSACLQSSEFEGELQLQVSFTYLWGTNQLI